MRIQRLWQNLELSDPTAPWYSFYANIFPTDHEKGFGLANFHKACTNLPSGLCLHQSAKRKVVPFGPSASGTTVSWVGLPNAQLLNQTVQNIPIHVTRPFPHPISHCSFSAGLTYRLLFQYPRPSSRSADPGTPGGGVPFHPWLSSGHFQAG